MRARARAWLRGARASLEGAWPRAAERIRAYAWPLLQQAVAAAIAWVIAVHIGHHGHPFFAPIAAVVSLNAPLGERGGNTLRLLEGVVIGILVGELAVGTLGSTTGALLLGIWVSTLITRALGGTAVSVAQAAAAAILTIAIADGHLGPDRLIDALIGGGVALVFSQIFFPPEPVRLLRHAESEAVNGMADALDLTANAIEDDDPALRERALDGVRRIRDQTVDLARTRRAGPRVASRSTTRSQLDPVVEETENAGQLDLLASSAVAVIRGAAAGDRDGIKLVAPSIRKLASVLRGLARDPGDRTNRQQAADSALKVARELQADGRVRDPALGSGLAAMIASVRAVAADTMIYAGVAQDEATAAIESGDGDLEVRSTPPVRRSPFKRPRVPWK
ncbi:MAG TPA: FUSC family protein [Solirubrobacteraceae bacterium]